MAFTLAEKILKAHTTDELKVGTEIGLKIDRTLTQDATGTMAYLEFEAMGIPRVKTECSVAYIDHNTLQSGFENADDHKFISSIAKKHGIYFSRPGNGVCHQVNLERFGVPGKTLIGSDSHTPTCGGIGMIAIGAGGLDVAVAMGGGLYYIPCPEIMGVKLTGKLNYSMGASAKDVILELLRRLTVKGGVGKIVEYFGDGIKNLTVPERATITNMGAELGATTSIFPSDDVTREFLKWQERENDWTELKADEGATYSEVIEIDLSQIIPLASCPHSPDNVKPVSELGDIKVDQVCIGSCTNSSYADLAKAAELLDGKTASENVQLSIAPGSKQVFEMLAESGALKKLIASGARILECACGPCIGMGQSPNTNGVSVRTFNRNFEGRSGTKSGQVYLVSVETAVATAINGFISASKDVPDVSNKIPQKAIINDNLIVPPATVEEAKNIEIFRGPNIKPFPVTTKLPEKIDAPVILKTGNNITTDHIMPAGAKILPLRSNIPAISEHCFTAVDVNFPARAKAAEKGFIVGGENYGQGSSREHAALAPLYLGIKAVVVKSFARIHMQNLINAGIIPLVFSNPDDYENIAQGDILSLPKIKKELENGSEITLENTTQDIKIPVTLNISERSTKILLAGGLLNL